MATIAGVNVGSFSVPENPQRTLNRSVGISQGGAVKIVELRNPDRVFSVTLTHKTAALMESLYTALEAAQNTTVSIDPDVPVDLGNGSGTAVNAYWLDPAWSPVKSGHEDWDITLRFRYSS